MDNYQIGPETFYTLSFTVLDGEGEVVGEADVIGGVFGTGLVLPKVEQKAEGHRAGDTFEVVLKPEDAFGKRRADAIIEVDPSDFPEGVTPGDAFEVENADGGVLVVHVLDVLPDAIVLDTNHPLADQTVKVLAEVLDVRLAEPEEIEAAEAQMQEDQAYLDAAPPDVTLSGLIRGGTRG